MNLFLGREDFERACRHAGMLALTFNAETGEYVDLHTQQAYLVWDSLAQSKHTSAQPSGWLVRRRGRDQAVLQQRPWTRLTPEEWEKQIAAGWELPLALWPAMPVTSASENAILSERQRQQLVKGYNLELDQRYQSDELIRAAAAYLLQTLMPDYAPTVWPWPGAPMKQETPLRAIEKAAALLIAEHERLSAAPAATQSNQSE